MSVDANVIVQPLLQNLTPSERESLVSAATTVAENFIAEAGLGETLVYNQLVALLMDIDGVLDVALELFPTSEHTGPRTRNVLPSDVGARPVVGTIDVQIGSSLVALDLEVTLTMEGAGTIGNAESNITSAEKEIQSDVQKGLNQFSGSQVDPVALLALIPASDTYQVSSVGYDRVEYLDIGIKIDVPDIPLPYTGLERFWVRSVKAQEAGAGA